MAERLLKPRGTLDWIGDSKRVYDALKASLAAECEKVGAEPIDVPSFEEKKLFVRGVGESSDIVSKEMFGLDVKGEHDYVLRPEFTAGVNRAAIENKLYSSPDLPLKFYYCGPVFRFERPQKGRLRQLSQFGVEFLDNRIDLSTALDCLLLFYRGAGKVLKRPLLLKLNYLGSFASRENYKKALKDFYAEKVGSMCEDCKRRYTQNVLRILDCKVPEDIEINKSAPLIQDYLVEEDKKAREKILAALDALKIPYEVDPKLVRGLDYYTGLVFELYDANHLDLGALGGGGQYGKLMSEIGGPDFEGIGFSYGMERLFLSLSDEEKQAYLKENKPSIDYFVIDLRKEKDLLPVLLADALRSLGKSVTEPSYSKAISGALKMADRKGAKKALIFDDYNPGKVLVKDLKERSQTAYDAKDVGSVLSDLEK